MNVKNTGNESERKQHFLQQKEKYGSSKKAYTDESKSTGRKVFADITRRGALPEEASMHTAEMTEIKIAMRDKKRENMRLGNIYSLAEFNARYQE